MQMLSLEKQGRRSGVLKATIKVLRGARAGASWGLPKGPGSSGGAHGSSIHSGCHTAAHNVPLSMLIWPLPLVLDPAKVQSLVDMMQKDPDSMSPIDSLWIKGAQGGDYFSFQGCHHYAVYQQLQ
ncbi:Sulfiredoxin-1 [Sciurus carolinensis]|uniref:Sulfiredoxin-1 n=1 Tax=Sciurus carolinensis TaxID=30640 RepID=A0AA41MYI8_SCICA|nr:Sulfiredoxin-1 [Sciurus carolinensis]